MTAITAELQKLIDDEKKRIDIQDRRTEERQKLEIEAYSAKDTGSKGSKEEEDLKRGRRRTGVEKSFRGCTEEEAEEALVKIFGEEKPEKYMHTLPDGRSMVVIKKNIITEGDIVRIEKGELFEIGEVKCLHRGILVLESREREKKYLISKLMSSRYVITPAALGKTKNRSSGMI